MIDWLEQRFAERKQQEEDSRFIAHHTETALSEMRAQLGAVASAAEAHGLSIIVTANSNCIVVRSVQPRIDEPAVADAPWFQLCLNINSRTIEAFPENIGFRAKLVRRGATVALVQHGKPLSYEDAARQLMEPFIFGDVA